MIANHDRTILLSSLGWVERDAVWLCHVPSGAVETIPCATGARYTSLHMAEASPRFALAHHFDGQRFDVTVRDFTDPRAVRARASLNERGESTLEGEPSVWSDVPRLYVEYLRIGSWRDFFLLNVSATTGEIKVQPLEWYGEAYDKNYQGVTGVLPTNDGRRAIFSVQRSSKLIVQDLQTGKKVGTIVLGDRHGNPRPSLRRAEAEIWAIDYDTLVVVRTEDGRILRSARLQPERAGTQEFVGDFSFSPDDRLCVVARPFSGDVVAVEPETLKIKSSAKSGGQPLELVALPEGHVVARDWKSGALLRGTLKRHESAG